MSAFSALPHPKLLWSLVSELVKAKNRFAPFCAFQNNSVHILCSWLVNNVKLHCFKSIIRLEIYVYVCNIHVVYYICIDHYMYTFHICMYHCIIHYMCVCVCMYMHFLVNNVKLPYPLSALVHTFFVCNPCIIFMLLTHIVHSSWIFIM